MASPNVDNDIKAQQTNTSNTQKRKSDVLSRVAEGTTSSKGRGAESGWTLCPLCGRYSQKRFALGRGITAHFHAMHTPWNPGSVERKKRRRLLKRQECEARKRNGATTQQKVTEHVPLTWDPTPKEQEEWDQRVVQIAAELEKQVKSEKMSNDECVRLDRIGKQSRSYRESLPPFVQAAADGNLSRLRAMVEECKNASSDGGVERITMLLETKDRNGSSAEHWAAGSGHLDCLKFLLGLRDETTTSSSTDDTTGSKRVRRRDGKTCLHYAARNGHLECIQYLLEQKHAAANIDEASGDGTTALHMACYGGHVHVVEYLMANGANPKTVNDWGCGCAHWVGMTKSTSTEDVRKLCRLLQLAGVSFWTVQKQGHSALHKAAQKKNRHVIEWMADLTENGGAGLSSEERKQASQADVGGHLPSEIWQSVGGDESFAQTIKSKFEDDK